MNATASCAIASTVSGVLPCEPPTPRLSKVMTRCFAAMPSTTLRVPIVEVRGQVIEEDHRYAGIDAELAVDESSAANGNRLCRRVIV